MFVCSLQSELVPLIKSSVFWPHAAPALYWNVNWYDWSDSQITHKATRNKDQDLSQSRPAEPWERERCVCVCVVVSSLLLPHIPLSDNKQNQSARRFMEKLKAHVLLRLEQCSLWSYANEEAFWCYKSSHYLKLRPSFLFSPSFFSLFNIFILQRSSRQRAVMPSVYWVLMGDQTCDCRRLCTYAAYKNAPPLPIHCFPHATKLTPHAVLVAIKT